MFLEVLMEYRAGNYKQGLRINSKSVPSER